MLLKGGEIENAETLAQQDGPCPRFGHDPVAVVHDQVTLNHGLSDTVVVEGVDLGQRNDAS